MQNKNLKYFLILILVAMVLAIGGFYLYNYLCPNGGYGKCYPTKPVTKTDQTTDWEKFYNAYGKNFEKNGGTFEKTFINKNSISFSPDNKFVSFIVVGYEYSQPYIVNTSNGIDILKGKNIWFTNPKKDAVWFLDGKLLVVKSYLNQFSGEGQEAIFTNGKNNIEHLIKVYSIPEKDYMLGKHIGDTIKFSDNKISFFVIEDSVELDYFYNFKTQVIEMHPRAIEMNWTKGKDYSEHIGSKHAEFVIEKPGLGRNIKTLDWPEIKNISDQNIYNKINKLLDFDTNLKKYYGEAFSSFDATEYSGIGSMGFFSTYDKNNIISLSFWIETYGAYPDEINFVKNINIKTGDIIDIKDIIDSNKNPLLVNALNIKLQNTITDALKEDACTSSILDQFEFGKTYNPDYGKVTEKDLASFKIISTGMEFFYDFGFPHVVKACEPNIPIVLTFEELKNYALTDGLLQNEIN
jgi:hypothetical protein